MRRFIAVVSVWMIGLAQLATAQVNSLSTGDDSVRLLVVAEIQTSDPQKVVDQALKEADPLYKIEKEVTSEIFTAIVSADDVNRLQLDPTIIVQENQQRFLMVTSDQLLSHIGADVAHMSPHNAKGSDYATVILDTGVRATHSFFTTTGEAYDIETNPSRVVLEHCQSGGQPIVDSGGNFILDTSGNKLYEGISTCAGNSSEATIIDDVTYYSNTVPGTLLPSFGASAPCNAEYPGFSSGCRHGSHVAGIAAGTRLNYGGTDYSGVAPESPLYVFNVFTKYTDPSVCGGGGSCLAANDADIIAALSQVESLLVEGARIGSINMSFGGGLYSDETSCKNDNLIYYYAFERLRSYGIPIVIAAGNSASRDKISAPACVPNAYSVGATTMTAVGVDVVASYSNIAQFIDFLAPGSSILSANSNDETGFFASSGTSMATPVVAASFTLLRSLFDGTHPGYPLRTLDAIADALKSTAVLLDDNRTQGSATGLPRIKIAEAIEYLVSKPYITLPNKSNYTVTYPMEYVFSVSGSADIDQSAIVLTELVTAGVGTLECTPVSTASYNCVLPVVSPGDIQIHVTDVLDQSYVSPVVGLTSIPSVTSISTTAETGTYGIGTTIPITITVGGIDSSLEKSSTMVAVLNNGASVSVTAVDSFSNNMVGTYTVGDNDSSEDVEHLEVASFSNIALHEYDGTRYSNVSFVSTDNSNLDQDGKSIRIQVTPTAPETPVVSPPVVNSGGGGGGNYSAPAVLTKNEKVDFCNAELAIELTDGSSGKDVETAEFILQELGLFSSMPNKDYNSATTRAVMSLQQRYSPSHLTGSIDSQTWEILKFASGCKKKSPKRTIFSQLRKSKLLNSKKETKLAAARTKTKPIKTSKLAKVNKSKSKPSKSSIALANTKTSEATTSELIIKYNKSIIDLNTPAGVKMAKEFISKISGLKSKEQLRSNNVELVEYTSPESSIDSKISKLQSYIEVEYAQPNIQHRLIESQSGARAPFRR